jgi:cell division protein FtsW (lipid II flippase)
MALCGFLSMLFVGVKPLFCLGLFIGTAVSVINVCMLAWFTELSVNKGNRFLPGLGLLLRMVIYAAAFAITLLLLGSECVTGTAIGFVTVYAAIFFVNGVELRLAKKRMKREQEE